MKIENVNVYYGENASGETTGSSSVVDASTVSELSTAGIADDPNKYALYLECESEAGRACESLLNDTLSDFRITEGPKKEEIEKWIEDIRLFYSPTTRGIFPELLEDSFLYGNVARQIIRDNGTITKIHRLDPLSTTVVKDPFSDDPVVIHTFTKDNTHQYLIFAKDVNKNGSENTEVIDALKKNISEVKSVSGTITWENIENCIVFEAKSLMKGDCFNAIAKKFDLMFGIGKYIDERAASPPVAFQVGEVVDGKPIGYPEKGKEPEYQTILDTITQSAAKIKTKNTTAFPGYVKPVPLPFTINNIYIKNKLDKCDQMICSSFYYNEAFAKSGAADFKRDGLMKQRREFLQRSKLKIQALVNYILKLQFGENLTEKFEFIKDSVEERKDQAEADNMVLDGLQKLQNLGADEETLEKYATRYGFKFNITAKEGTRAKEEFGERVETLSVFEEDLLALWNENVKEASEGAFEKIQKLAEKSSGFLDPDEYDKMMEVLDAALLKMEKKLKSGVYKIVSDSIAAESLPVKENKKAIEFLQRYTFDEFAVPLKIHQRQRLKIIFTDMYDSKGTLKGANKLVAEALGKSEREAKTTVITELKRSSSWSRVDHALRVAEENGLEPWGRLSPIHDDTTCAECKADSGKEYPIREIKKKSPRHPKCRCPWTLFWKKKKE
uniref:Phage head morphogenesis protein, SPP1 gp7 family n=1 Tax=Methanococcus maripaludis (strain C6 / ATCC BAA-1332) TaxID=444158 RepID=A9A7H3_METM6